MILPLLKKRKELEYSACGYNYRTATEGDSPMIFLQVIFMIAEANVKEV